MNPRHLRSFGLLFALGAAACAPFLANCAAPEDVDDELSEEAYTGVRNALGLRLTYDADTGRVNATLKDSLKAGEQLRIRIRRGLPKIGDEKRLDCDALREARPITGEGERDPALVGKVVYQGPKVDPSMLSLLDVYDDHRFQSDPAWAAERIQEINAAGGPKVLVEACITRPSGKPVRLQTNLEQAWDLGAEDAKAVSSLSASGIGIRADGGGGDDGDGGAGDGEETEEALRSMEKYAEKCVEDLGEIPFFKKLADGRYDTFDCRDFVGTGEDHEPEPVPGVEGTMIPLTQDDRPVTRCDGEGEHGTKSFSSYNCVDKCDKAEFLESGCEPGPTVTHAKNEAGSHWVLLCRKVARGEEVGWTKTKVFDDIAMIGHNPKNGKTCYFQNTIGSGNDGEHVPHPADVEKSRTLWDTPKGYCFESCHGTDPFIQSPWINGARKANNKPVVPMMGADPDFEISWLEAPYYVVNMDAQGWTMPQQLVSEDAGPCLSCHRVGGDTWMRRFANWTTGAGEGGGPMDDRFWGKITDSYKTFEKSHWMPMRLDGLTEENWAESKWGRAMQHINTCQANRNDPACEWADVPRGAGNPPAPGR